MKSSMIKVKRKPYNEHGYSETNSGAVRCTISKDPNAVLEMFLFDSVDGKTYDAGFIQNPLEADFLMTIWHW